MHWTFKKFHILFPIFQFFDLLSVINAINCLVIAWRSLKLIRDCHQFSRKLMKCFLVFSFLSYYCIIHTFNCLIIDSMPLILVTDSPWTFKNFINENDLNFSSNSWIFFFFFFLNFRPVNALIMALIPWQII